MSNVKEIKINNTVYDVVGKGVDNQRDHSTSKVWIGSNAQYKALGSLDNNTIYYRPDNGGTVQRSIRSESSDLIGNISNCITEIPQDINLTLSNGTLTLKSGSNLYVPNGTVSEYQTTTDKITAGSGVGNTKQIVFARTDDNALVRLDFSNVASGSTQPSFSNGYWYDTTNNKIRWINNGTILDRSIAFPICTITITNGVITSIDKVFNGVGYIGSSRFILPGIKCLEANGINQDGTLNSILYTSQELSIYTFPSEVNGTSYGTVGSEKDNFNPYYIQTTTPSTNGLWYNPETNMFLRSTDSGSTWIQRKAVVFTKSKITAGVISDLEFLSTPVRLATTEMLDSGLSEKQNTITGAASTITETNLTTNRALASDGSGKVAVSSVTNTELGYLSGTTSAIQTQLNGKASTSLDNLSSAGQMIIDSQNGTISNCILDIPQDIKIEISGGTLTVKSGSKVYKPNGTQYQYTNDSSISLTGVLTKWFIFDNGWFGANTLRATSSVNIYSGTTAPQNPSVGDVWFDTTNLKIQAWQDGAWTGDRSLPMCVVSAENGVITSIDQVFNGFGYIGSSLFVLPGVKHLYAQGLNFDGTLKSELHTVNSLIIRTETGGTNTYGFAFGGNIGLGDYSYDIKTNYVYTGGQTRPSITYAGTTRVENGVIKSLDINLPVRLATTEMLDKKQDALVSGTNIKTINNTSLLGTGNISVESLPSQSGQSGKYLTTNGTSASWGSVDLYSLAQNASATAKQTIVGWVIPDYESEVSGTTAAWGEWVQAQKDSFVVWTGSDGYTENVWAYVSPDQGTTTYVVGYRYDDQNAYTEGTTFSFLVPAGWWFKASFESDNAYHIYPLKGVSQ